MGSSLIVRPFVVLVLCKSHESDSKDKCVLVNLVNQIGKLQQSEMQMLKATEYGYIIRVRLRLQLNLLCPFLDDL